ncbi:hypothetical protein [Kribbella pratensis]|uniref:Uncharacterized protein n=1 Tax=Kribbella pratensis TaxID=2512112 RepID=A0A4R8CP64_9ACTN|nr:hypothetical protein [Kribbella pratensis]TDW77922.1 hypothetical protein EV653_3102 [Kribbella pratensis]
MTAGWARQIADGATDLLACAPDATRLLLAAAGPRFYPCSRVDVIVIAPTGHVTNLHRNADLAYRSITARADRTVGTAKKGQLVS